MKRRPSPSAPSRRAEAALARAAEIRLQYSRGRTITELAELHGRHKGTISRIVRGQRCARAPGPTVQAARARATAALSDSQIRAMRHAAAAGTSTAELAAQHNLSPTTVRRLLRGHIRPEAGGPLVNFDDRTALNKAEHIRAQYAAGVSQRSLAAEHGLSRSAIGAIVRGDAHSAAPGPTRRDPDPRTKRLTPSQVRRIREAYASGATMTALARRYDKLLSSIAHVVMGRTYRHAGGPMGDAARAAHQRARKTPEGEPR